MTPKVKIFENVFSDSATGHRTTFRDQTWWKSAVAKLPKGPLDYHTKNRAPRDSSQSPFCAKLADRTQNSLNVVHVQACRIWSRSAALCRTLRTYSGKIDFSAPKVITMYRFSAYNIQQSMNIYQRYERISSDTYFMDHAVFAKISFTIVVVIILSSCWSDNKAVNNKAVLSLKRLREFTKANVIIFTLYTLKV